MWSKVKNNSKHRLLVALMILLMSLALSLMAVLLYSSQEAAAPTEEVANEEAAVEPIEYDVEGRYLFSGTVVLARAVEKFAVDANGQTDYGQPFSGLDTFEPSKYDAWLVDLECPATDALVSYQQQIESLIFNCPIEFLPEMYKYITLINLANNHTSDLGKDGFNETQQNLADAGFQHFGNYDPSVSEDVCEVVALPVRLGYAEGERDGKLPVAFCSWHYFFRDPLSNELEVMEKFAEVMPVFAFQHAGVEYVATAGGNQPGLAKSIIDLGAEFVIGNSPHWVQNTEVYKGKLIAYSTGNFIFDQLETETNRGANFDLTISVNYDENLEKWLELGESCAEQNDNCLQEAIDLGLEKVDLDLKWDIVASLGGVREITRKADSATQKAVEERANWAETLEELN